MAWTEQRHHSCHLRSHAGGSCQRTCSTFKGGDTLFKGRVCRVHDARVDIAKALQGKEVGGMIGVVEDKGCGLIDRHGSGTRSGIGSLPGMNREGVEAKDVIAVDFWHGLFAPMLAMSPFIILS